MRVRAHVWQMLVAAPLPIIELFTYGWVNNLPDAFMSRPGGRSLTTIRGQKIPQVIRGLDRLLFRKEVST